MSCFGPFGGGQHRTWMPSAKRITSATPTSAKQANRLLEMGAGMGSLALSLLSHADLGREHTQFGWKPEKPDWQASGLRGLLSVSAAVQQWPWRSYRLLDTDATCRAKYLMWAICIQLRPYYLIRRVSCCSATTDSTFQEAVEAHRLMHYGYVCVT